MGVDGIINDGEWREEIKISFARQIANGLGLGAFIFCVGAALCGIFHYEYRISTENILSKVHPSMIERGLVREVQDGEFIKREIHQFGNKYYIPNVGEYKK